MPFTVLQCVNKDVIIIIIIIISCIVHNDNSKKYTICLMSNEITTNPKVYYNICFILFLCLKIENHYRVPCDLL